MKSKLIFCSITEQTARLPVYVTGAGYWEHQEAINRPSGFPDYQWMQVISGEGELQLAGDRMPLRPGSGFLLLPGIAHAYKPVRKPWEVAWVTFNGDRVMPMLELAGAAKAGPYAAASSDSLLVQLRAMLALAESPLPAAAGELSKLLYAMLVDFGSLLGHPGSASGQSSDRLRPVFGHIAQNCHRTLSLDELAAVAGVTPQYLCTLFKRHVDMRPMEYVNLERINRSKALMLQESGRKMHEIARLVGFEHPGYFSATFKRLVGMPPERFRRLHGL